MKRLFVVLPLVVALLGLPVGVAGSCQPGAARTCPCCCPHADGSGLHVRADVCHCRLSAVPPADAAGVAVAPEARANTTIVLGLPVRLPHLAAIDRSALTVHPPDEFPSPPLLAVLALRC